MKKPENMPQRNESIEAEIMKERSRLLELASKIKKSTPFERLGIKKDVSSKEEINEILENNSPLFEVFNPEGKNVNLKEVYMIIYNLYKQAKVDIEKSWETILQVAKNGSNSFSNIRDSLVNKGLISIEIANKIAKEVAEKNISEALILGPNSFKIIRDAWVDLGVITKEEANNLVKEKVKQNISEALILGPNTFKIIRDAWVDLGFTIEENG